MPVLTRLQVTFRCLRGVEMDFTSPEDGSPSPFIALVGANGAGKTTVLESIALSIASLLTRARQLTLRPALGEEVILHFFRRGPTHFPKAFGSSPDPAFSAQLRQTLSIRSGYLPTIPVGKPLSTGGKGPLPLEFALMAQPTSHKRIAAVHQWWLHQHLEYPETTNLHRLWKALAPFLGDLVYAGVNPADHMPMFDARGTRVSFNELSSGERRIILLFLEIAMQCGEDGLVLFDEPEAHFHPRWQQMIPGALAQLLPRGQVIVATHSPHIVEGLPAHQLFVLGDMPW